MNLRYEEIEFLSTKCGIKTPFCPSDFLPKKNINYQIALTEIDKYFRDAHIPKFLLSLTLAGESSWLLNRQQFLKHKIYNARHITVHRDSIIVLAHFVHRAFDLEAPIKQDKVPFNISYTIMAPFKYDESTINAPFGREEREKY